MATTDIFFMSRCPQCGEVILHRHISLFMIHGKGKISISCSCGFLICTIAPQGQKHYQVEIWSTCCQSAHRFIFTLGQMLKGCLSLECGKTDLHLGYLGNREKVIEEIVEDDVLSWEDGFSLWDFFADIDCMIGILERFYQLLGEGKIQCHNCGQDVDVRIYRDRIELRCPHCDYGGFLSAATSVDRASMEQAAGLILEKEGINIIYGNTIK